MNKLFENIYMDAQFLKIKENCPRLSKKLSYKILRQAAKTLQNKIKDSTLKVSAIGKNKKFFEGLSQEDIDVVFSIVYYSLGLLLGNFTRDLDPYGLVLPPQVVGLVENWIVSSQARVAKKIMNSKYATSLTPGRKALLDYYIDENEKNGDLLVLTFYFPFIKAIKPKAKKLYIKLRLNPDVPEDLSAISFHDITGYINPDDRAFNSDITNYTDKKGNERVGNTSFFLNDFAKKFISTFNNKLKYNYKDSDMSPILYYTIEDGLIKFVFKESQDITSKWLIIKIIKNIGESEPWNHIDEKIIYDDSGKFFTYEVPVSGDFNKKDRDFKNYNYITDLLMDNSDDMLYKVVDKLKSVGAIERNVDDLPLTWKVLPLDTVADIVVTSYNDHLQDILSDKERKVYDTFLNKYIQHNTKKESPKETSLEDAKIENTFRE